MPQTTTRHEPTRFFVDRESSEDPQSCALIILNQPLLSRALIERLWKLCKLKICADGGANELYNLYGGEEHPLPDAIHGDLDSLRQDVREYYSARGVPVTRNGDQYSTDFGKAMLLIAKEMPDATDVLVLGGLGGRVDQGIGILGELLREERKARERLDEDAGSGFKIWLVSERSVSFWVEDGERCTVALDSTKGPGSVFTPNAGILPLQGKAHISIKGFEWDVSEWETYMGGQLSTSNHVVAEEVEIETDVAVLFTIERQMFSSKDGNR